jgi:hypothetical protein
MLQEPGWERLIGELEVLTPKLPVQVLYVTRDCLCGANPVSFFGNSIDIGDVTELTTIEVTPLSDHHG